MRILWQVDEAAGQAAFIPLQQGERDVILATGFAGIFAVVVSLLVAVAGAKATGGE